jgi:hypothetical protein
LGRLIIALGSTELTKKMVFFYISSGLFLAHSLSRVRKFLRCHTSLDPFSKTQVRKSRSQVTPPFELIETLQYVANGIFS